MTDFTHYAYGKTDGPDVLRHNSLCTVAYWGRTWPAGVETVAIPPGLTPPRGADVLVPVRLQRSEPDEDGDVPYLVHDQQGTYVEFVLASHVISKDGYEEARTGPTETPDNGPYSAQDLKFLVDVAEYTDLPKPISQETLDLLLTAFRNGQHR